MILMSQASEPRNKILDEIHAIREKLINDHGGIAGLAAFLRQREANTDREIRVPSSENQLSLSTSRNRNRPTETRP